MWLHKKKKCLNYIETVYINPVFVGIIWHYFRISCMHRVSQLEKYWKLMIWCILFLTTHSWPKAIWASAVNLLGVCLPFAVYSIKFSNFKVITISGAFVLKWQNYLRKPAWCFFLSLISCWYWFFKML